MKIIAHRCGTDIFPQQTIHSARYSLEHGADLVEVDIRFTKDNVPVVIHDPSPLLLYGAVTPVRLITAKKFLSLRRTADPSFCGHTFKDYLDCGIENMLFHIKEGGERLDMILSMCDKKGILDKVVFGVSSVEDVNIVKNYDKNIKVLAFMPSPGRIEDFAEAGADYIRLWQGWLSEDNISRVKTSGKELWIMANNGFDVGEVEDGDYELFASTGAEGLLINKVLPAVEFFRK